MTSPVAGPVTFIVTDALAAGDPCGMCVDFGTGFAGHPDVSVPGCAGEWTVTAERAEVGDWGVRTVRLVAVRADAGELGQPESVGLVGIDTGTVVLCDNAAVAGGELDYDEVCEATLAPGPRGARPLPRNIAGVVSDTGIGDGGYDVLVSPGADGRPGQVDIVFISDADFAALT